eukprot:TRINITY_DN9625_c1_g2_i1.p1 TRINITY_DN9625_c1_g2~~TRINITY_DN9625_c1_g2_i1.p1  ORF type:complete len:322 (+),score=70.54 TRINITY_DN9625_c1_g2_i1:77-967(+)
MTEAYSLEEEVKNELKLLQLQLEHSKKERKKRELEREETKIKELSKLKEQLATTTADDLGDSSSTVSAGTASTVGTSTVGQITVKKARKNGPQRIASVISEQPSTGEEEQKQASLNPAELKRQREQEQQQKKEQREVEEKARVEAQKSDPAKEKGGDIKYYVKGKLKGWNETKGFLVARAEGLFFYKSAPQGRGSTAGGITYDPTAKSAMSIQFVVLETNSRGSTVPHRSSCNISLMPGDHPKIDEKTDASVYFSVSFFDPKAKSFQTQLLRCNTKGDRDEWGKFISKFIRVQGLK